MAGDDESTMLIKVAICGDGGVGKSAISFRFFLDEFVDEYDPTVEDNYRKLCDVDGHLTMVEWLDTAGQEEFKALRSVYMREREGFMLVYSITSEDSFNNMKSFRDMILREKEADEWPMVLVGTKADLDEEREVTTAEGEKLAAQFGIPFFETSALQNMNVQEAVEELIRVTRVHKDPNFANGGGGKKKKKCIIL